MMSEFIILAILKLENEEDQNFMADLYLNYYINYVMMEMENSKIESKNREIKGE